jgi:O-antigen/teichoic acid export membrane protein
VKIHKAIRYIRLNPFDNQTEQGRTDERYRVAAISILANVLSRLFAIFLTILGVSLTLPYLGPERFGIWMTIASFAAILTFLDLGVGNALTNHVAQRAALGDASILRRTISGGLGFLAVIGLCMGVVLWLLATNLPWEKIIKITDKNLITELRATAKSFAVLFGLNIISSGVVRVYVGLQQAFKAHLVTALVTFFACIAIWYAAEEEQGIVVLLTIVLGAQTLSGIILLYILAIEKLIEFKEFLPGIINESRHLLKTGGLFFILQIGTMIGWGADSLIIANTLGAAHVAIFSVVQRLFQFSTQPLSIINAPLWPAYADAHARGEKTFIRNTLHRSMLITFYSSAGGAIILLLFHPWFVEKWTHGMIVAPFGFVAFYAVWSILDACGNAFSMFLNGTNVVKIQVIAVIGFILLSLPIKLSLINHIGLMSIPGATAVSYLIAVVGIYVFFYKKTFQEKK